MHGNLNGKSEENVSDAHEGKRETTRRVIKNDFELTKREKAPGSGGSSLGRRDWRVCRCLFCIQYTYILIYRGRDTCRRISRDDYLKPGHFDSNIIYSTFYRTAARCHVHALVFTDLSVTVYIMCNMNN